MNNSFAIGIPTLNRADLLINALGVYVNQFPNTKIFVIDNGGQKLKNVINHPNIIIFEKENNVGVAESWNELCNHIFVNHEHALILNDDIVLDGNEGSINKIISDRQKPLYFDVCPLSWCAFIISKKAFNEIGEFDKSFFPAYFEDNDYSYRIKLKGKRIVHNMNIIPKVYRQSQTMEKDETIRKAYRENQRRYIGKWGGLPEQEKFTKPYNG